MLFTSNAIAPDMRGYFSLMMLLYILYTANASAVKGKIQPFQKIFLPKNAEKLQKLALERNLFGNSA